MYNDFVNAVLNNQKTHDIIAYFNNGHEPAQYTMNIYQYLVTDPTVQTIIDAATGEIIYDKRGVI